MQAGQATIPGVGRPASVERRHFGVPRRRVQLRWSAARVVGSNAGRFAARAARQRAGSRAAVIVASPNAPRHSPLRRKARSLARHPISVAGRHIRTGQPCTYGGSRCEMRYMSRPVPRRASCASMSWPYSRAWRLPSGSTGPESPAPPLVPTTVLSAAQADGRIEVMLSRGVSVRVVGQADEGDCRGGWLLSGDHDRGSAGRAGLSRVRRPI